MSSAKLNPDQRDELGLTEDQAKAVHWTDRHEQPEGG
jgi:hypothetical protein